MRWALPVTLLLAACQPGAAPDRDDTVAVFSPNYGAVETRLLADDLVQFDLSMQGARTAQDVADYADCVAAEYTLIRGLAFVRHVRTNLDIPTRQDTGIWRADAVYTVSPDLPRGRQTIDAISRVEDCRDRGIPTV